MLFRSFFLKVGYHVLNGIIVEHLLNLSKMNIERFFEMDSFITSIPLSSIKIIEEIPIHCRKCIFKSIDKCREKFETTSNPISLTETVFRLQFPFFEYYYKDHISY